MSAAAMPQPPDRRRILDVVRKYWGYDALRPLQERAIHAGLCGRDSLVVLPTGGGKSLCYQVPPLLAGRTDLVVSPLIALMKDQSDGLRRCGYPAAALHGNLTPDELRHAEAQLLAGRIRLLYVAPERLVTPRFLSLLDRLDIRAFAIDEAHCISHWGHDFRQEYRQLAILKQRFPGASVQAYTATATPRVQRDIVEQLRLHDPIVLVGSFDRPNLIYRVVPRIDVYRQVLEIVRRHDRQAVIVYCISRDDTERVADHLVRNQVRAAHYHAGMDADYRRRTQDAFAEERLDVIVATVAFGMGIDRSDVRCVIHANLPKSIEHYQQETGRAGRDGLEAECVLLYSAADVMRWEKLINRSAEEAEAAAEVSAAARELLHRMRDFANAPVCRHRALSEYFGQRYEPPSCGACDVCLDETEVIPDGAVIAQKILSCVARVGQRFGVNHVVDVLRGAHTEMVQSCRHDRLSTYGLLKDLDRKTLVNLVHQLVDQGLLDRGSPEKPILKLNAASWEVMRGKRQVRLIKPAAALKRTRHDAESWEGVDAELFESLRTLRRELAEKEKVPAYLIFGDATLRELARFRPSTLERFGKIRGVGRKKLADYGLTFTTRIHQHCHARGFTTDQPMEEEVSRRPARPMSRARRQALEMFARQASIEEVMQAVGRARSTTTQYLVEYIAAACPETIDCWVDAATYHRVAEAARRLGAGPLRRLFEALDGQVPYDTIRLVVRHLDALGSDNASALTKDD